MGWFDSVSSDKRIPNVGILGQSGYKQPAAKQPVKQQLPIVKIRGVPMAFDKSTGNYWLGNTPLNTNDGSMSMWLKDQAGSTDYYIVENAKPSIQKSAVIRQVSRVKNNPAKAVADFKSVINSSPVLQAQIQPQVIPQQVSQQVIPQQVSQQPQSDGGLLSALARYFRKTPEQAAEDQARMDAMFRSWEHGAVGDTSLLYK